MARVGRAAQQATEDARGRGMMKQDESTMHSKIRRCLYINMKSARPLGPISSQTWTGSSNSEGARVGAQGLAAFHSSKAAKEWAMPRLCQAPGRSAQCEPASPAGRSCAPCAHPVLSQDKTSANPRLARRCPRVPGDAFPGRASQPGSLCCQRCSLPGTMQRVCCTRKMVYQPVFAPSSQPTSYGVLT